MSRKKSQYVAAAGQYYVAYDLAKKGFHVSLTIGNAPNVDLLVATSDGSKAFSVQVKTSTHVSRKHKKVAGKYWIIGKCPLKGVDVWYAFVDLNKDSAEVYYVHSDVVYAYSHRILSMPFFFMSDGLARQYRNIPTPIFGRPVAVPPEILQNAP